jgi:hypothetical protein
MHIYECTHIYKYVPSNSIATSRISILSFTSRFVRSWEDISAFKALIWGPNVRTLWVQNEGGN